MNAAASARVNGRAPVWVAFAATLLMLGLPLEGSAPGRYLTERVFIVAALVVIALASAPGSSSRRAHTTLNAAIGLLAITAALVLANIAPSGAILLGIAAGSLIWQKRLWSME